MDLIYNIKFQEIAKTLKFCTFKEITKLLQSFTHPKIKTLNKFVQILLFARAYSNQAGLEGLVWSILGLNQNLIRQAKAWLGLSLIIRKAWEGLRLRAMASYFIVCHRIQLKIFNIGMFFAGKMTKYNFYALLVLFCCNIFSM